MKKVITLLLAIAMIITCFAGCGKTEEPQTAPAETPAETPAEAPTGRTEPLVLSLGSTGTASEDDNQYASLSYFMETITEKTNGMITFDYYPNAQLGSEADMFDQILTGTLDIAIESNNVIASVWPEFFFISLPFAFPSEEAYWEYMRTDGVYDYYRQITSEDDLCVFLAGSTSGFRGMQNSKHAIRCADDMKGLQFRIMSGQIFSDMFTALGASVANVAFSEIYTAIQQGVIDGEDLTISYFYDQGLTEVEGYTSELNMVAAPSVLLMSTDAWNKLTPEEQELFYEVADGMADVCIEFSKRTDEFYEKVAETGVEVTRFADLTSEEVQSFYDATAGMWAEYRDIIGHDFYDYMKAVRDDVLTRY